MVVRRLFTTNASFPAPRPWNAFCRCLRSAKAGGHNGRRETSVLTDLGLQSQASSTAHSLTRPRASVDWPDGIRKAVEVSPATTMTLRQAGLLAGAIEHHHII
jgi:hypothetical protein